MAFDPKLDKELFKTEKNFETTKLIVSIRSYNEGLPKIQISRSNRTNDNWVFAKLGRLTKEEAEALSEMLKEAVSHLKE